MGRRKRKSRGKSKTSSSADTAAATAPVSEVAAAPAAVGGATARGLTGWYQIEFIDNNIAINNSNYKTMPNVSLNKMWPNVRRPNVGLQILKYTITTFPLPLHRIFSCPALAPLPLIQFSDPASPACECPSNTRLWPSTLISDGRRSLASSFNRLSCWQQPQLYGRWWSMKGNWRWDRVLVLLWRVMVPDDPANWPIPLLTFDRYPPSSGISDSLHQRTVPGSRMLGNKKFTYYSRLLTLFARHLTTLRDWGSAPLVPLWAPWWGNHRNESFSNTWMEKDI